jgi:hypothetical protein
VTDVTPFVPFVSSVSFVTPVFVVPACSRDGSGVAAAARAFPS